MIQFEFFGIPRLRARTGGLAVEGETLGAAVAALGRACPALADEVLADDRVHPAFRVSLNGERFVSDPETPLADGDTLLLLSADVGG